MKQFTDKDLLLSTDMIKTLYHDFTRNMPILDYHCHINPQEIYEDHRFGTVIQVWLGGGHYEWRQMRSNGVGEKYVTGDSTNREKFQAWAETIPRLIGNPLYYWSHLELKRCFGYRSYLNGDTVEEVQNLCNTRLQEDFITVRNLIRQSGMTLICTTDDPVDSLGWRKRIAKDNTFDVQTLPTWKPDKTINVEKPAFGAYMAQLSQVSGIQITDLASLKKALKKCMALFAPMGCCISNHTLEYVTYTPAVDPEVNVILVKGLKGETVSKGEELEFKTALVLSVAWEYNAMGWIMQIHYGCKRDNNGYVFEKLGTDTGFGCTNNYAPSAQMADFLNALSTSSEVPKTILYSLDPNDNAPIGTIIGCFQGRFPGKIRQGPAWWFSDHKTGMTEQVTSPANLGCLDNLIDVLTDSRSFLSYTGHEYFRRILCNLTGGWIENGEYPADMKVLGEIMESICYSNSVKYFGFKLDEVK